MGLGDKVVERWHSPRTQRELTLARWGHYGTPLLVFPTAGGDAEEIERHHLLGHLAEAVDAGRVKVYSVDSTAGRALSTHEGSPEHRMWLFNQYHDAIASEVVPAIQADTGGHEIVAAGSSIGAFNALAMVCRYPQLFRAAICMSGTFHMEKFIGGINDDLYFSSRCTSSRGWRARSSTCCASGSSSWPPAPVAGRTPGSRGRSGTCWGKGDPEPGRRLGPGVRPRLADLVEDAPDLRGRDRRMTDDAVASAVDRLMAQARDDLERLVAIPSVASEERAPSRRAGRRRSWSTALPRPGRRRHPAHRRRRRQRRRRRSDRRSGRRATVLLYAHYDVQPAGDEDAWSSDPWTLTERDGRWYARGAADCKGNLVMHLTALRALRDVDGGWPVSLMVVCEGSEEMSTGGLERLVAAEPELFAADVIVVADTGNVEAGVPTVTTSLRGTGSVLVTVRTLAGPVHSGAFGGAAPDAMAALIRVLDTLRDDDGATTVAG